MSWQAVTLILGLAFIVVGAVTAAVCVVAWAASTEKRVEMVMRHGPQRFGQQPEPPDLKLVE